MIETVCAGAGETKALAADLAGRLRPGDLLLLSGDLGAGKTTFTQGLAAALRVDDAVTSPTFTLVNIHPTTAGFDLVHVDVYRLERLSEVEDLALPELLDDGAVVVVEWGERARAALPAVRLEVTITADGTDADGTDADGTDDEGTDDEGTGAGDDAGGGKRTVTFDAVGGDWETRLEGLAWR